MRKHEENKCAKINGLFPALAPFLRLAAGFFCDAFIA